MTRDGQTKYTNMRNMIRYKRKLAEGQLDKYKASTQWQEMARRSTQTPGTWSIIEESWPKASFTNTRQSPITRDCQTKYTNTRNMIYYKKKLAEGQLYKYKASTQWQEMARRSTRTPETWFIIKESWPKASFTNTRQAPNHKRWRDEVHEHQKHDSL